MVTKHVPVFTKNKPFHGNMRHVFDGAQIFYFVTLVALKLHTSDLQHWFEIKKIAPSKTCRILP